MSFGIRRPFEYDSKSRRVIHPESYDTCPVCGKPTPSTDGLIPVAPCLVPLTEQDDYEPVVIFGCSSCYKAQKSLNFVTVEDFRLNRQTKKSIRLDNRQKRPVGRPRKNPELVQKGKDDFLYSMYLQIRDRLIALGYELGSTGLIIGRNDTEESDLSRRATSQGLPDDDIEFGMTDEQRARMDQAVHAASERTKLIPSEAWNGKTADEILGDGVPNGW